MKLRGRKRQAGTERAQQNGRVEVSVLTPVLNEEAHIRETVAAMRNQEFEGAVEFLFMDGGSTDGTRAILEQLAREDPRIRVLDNPGRGIPQGLNVGLRHARGDYVARMDAHAHYPPAYLARGVERLQPGDVGWVAGAPIPAGGGKWSRRISLALRSPLGVGGSPKWATESETGLDTGVFGGVWRRTTLEQLDGWDEGWAVNEDSELAARWRAAGMRIVGIPELAARYIPRDSVGALARQYARYGFYRAKTASRHPDSMRRSLWLPPALVTTALTAVIGPRPIRGFARAGMAVYGAALLAGSALAADARPTDRAALPIVFATMHGSWGAGFLAGAARFGPPLAAAGRFFGFAGG
jgi:glycosyltransferase involved in cell wall biosynthesis